MDFGQEWLPVEEEKFSQGAVPKDVIASPSVTKCTGSNRFPKYERLKLKRHFLALYQHGEQIETPSLKVRFRIEPYDFNRFPMEYWLKVGFSVPKKRIKKGVVRNRIRRRMREAYRLNRNPLKDALKKRNLALKLLFIYHLNEEIPYRQIEEDMKFLLQIFIEKVNAADGK